MWNLMAILAVAATAAGDVSASRLDGTTVSGQLQSWTPEAVVVKTPTDVIRLPTAELASLDLSDKPTIDTGKPQIELVDGTILPLGKYSTDGQTLSGELAMPASAPAQPISLALDQVRAVRLQPLDPAILHQWQEIRDTDAPSDLLVLTKRGGKSLDYLEGIVGDVHPDEVEFTLDGKTMNVARGKVAGVIYFRAEAAAGSTSPCILHGQGGTRISAMTTRSNGNLLEVSTTTGLQFRWPLGDVASADFSAGKIVFLGDLEPATKSWQPFVGLPASAKRAAQYGMPRINRAASGGPLSLSFPDDSGATHSRRIETYPRGVALRSRTELVYRLPSGYRRFMAVAGIDPSDSAIGDVKLTIIGDDQLLTEANLAGASPPLPLELDVAGVKRLKIVVDYGQNLDTGDWLNLCNARIVK